MREIVKERKLKCAQHIYNTRNTSKSPPSTNTSKIRLLFRHLNFRYINMKKCDRMPDTITSRIKLLKYNQFEQFFTLVIFRSLIE